MLEFVHYVGDFHHFPWERRYFFNFALPCDILPLGVSLVLSSDWRKKLGILRFVLDTSLFISIFQSSLSSLSS